MVRVVQSALAAPLLDRWLLLTLPPVSLLCLNHLRVSAGHEDTSPQYAIMEPLRRGHCPSHPQHHITL
jgi:hypothetical protein